MGVIGNIIDIVKELRNLAKETSNQDMIDLAVKIQDKIFDLKNDIESVREENRKLKKEIENNNKVKEIECHIIEMKEPVFRLDNAKEDSLYCQNCWVKEQKLYKVCLYRYGVSLDSRFVCNNCKNDGYVDLSQVEGKL